VLLQHLKSRYLNQCQFPCPLSICPASLSWTDREALLTRRVRPQKGNVVRDRAVLAVRADVRLNLHRAGNQALSRPTATFTKLRENVPRSRSPTTLVPHGGHTRPGPSAARIRTGRSQFGRKIRFKVDASTSWLRLTSNPSVSASTSSLREKARWPTWRSRKVNPAEKTPSREQVNPSPPFPTCTSPRGPLLTCQRVTDNRERQRQEERRPAEDVEDHTGQG